MYSKKLLWAIGVSHLRQTKRKNRVTTRRQTATLVRQLSEVMWPGTTKKYDGQRETTVGNWRQSLEAKKAEKNRVTTRRQARILVRE